MALRTAAKTLAANRIAFGIGYLAAPRRTASGWVGKSAEAESSTVLTRALGARDLVLAAGAVAALRDRDERQARRWFAAQGIADGVDLIATLRARESLPESGFRFGLVMAAVSTGIALAAAVALELE